MCTICINNHYSLSPFIECHIPYLLFIIILIIAKHLFYLILLLKHVIPNLNRAFRPFTYCTYHKMLFIPFKRRTCKCPPFILWSFNAIKKFWPIFIDIGLIGKRENLVMTIDNLDVFKFLGEAVGLGSFKFVIKVNPKWLKRLKITSKVC